jgi:hypothetical protein
VNLARRWTSPSSVTVRWLLGVLPWIIAVTVVLVVLERGDRHAEVELLSDGPFATATIVSGDDDELQARYAHEVVGEVVADVDAGGAGEGDSIAIAYDVDDPYRVEPRDHEPRRDLTPWIVAGAVLVTAGSCAAAQWSARRQRQLAADESTAFSMLATIHHSRLSIVPRLSLYALDSAAGERPVCTIRLADIRVDGPNDACFPVDVKGIPRPTGLVVVRCDDAVLWPRGRALVAARHRRPERVTAPAVREARSVRQFLAWLAVCGVCGLLVTATVTIVSLHSARVTERWVADGRRAVATIVGRNEQSVNVDVLAADGSGPVRLMAAPVDYPDGYDPGQKYPAVVRQDGRLVRLLVEPYDALEPILWAAVPTAVLLWWALRRFIGA